MAALGASRGRSEEHTSELQSPIDISYAVFCLKKKKTQYAAPAALLDPSRHFRMVVIVEDDEVRLAHSRTCLLRWILASLFFFFNDTATTEIYTSIDTLSLHDALPI